MPPYLFLSGTSDLDQNGLPLLGTCFAPMPLPDENDWAIPYGQEGSKVIRCDGHNGEYCYYIKGEGKDRVRGNETSIYPEFLKTGTNIGVGNLPLNGVISDNRTYPGKTASVVPGTKRAPELMNMDLGAISARQSAPTDGRDPFAGGGFYTSKQNSDAFGMHYQWGRKDPFTFATSSQQWQVSWGGMYPVKIYTIDGVLIYQENNGGSNKDKQPVGGVVVSSTGATSMMETIKNPISFHGGGNGELITQVGHTKALWDYYWSSYSRGTDGASHPNRPNWHNDYLEGYVSNRLKSIYDPCPIGFRILSNGTCNQFISNSGWLGGSYLGGTMFRINENLTWFPGLGAKSSVYNYVGQYAWMSCSTPSSNIARYTFQIGYEKVIINNRYNESRASSYFVRCIEDCDPQSDGLSNHNLLEHTNQNIFEILSIIELCNHLEAIPNYSLIMICERNLLSLCVKIK